MVDVYGPETEWLLSGYAFVGRICENVASKLAPLIDANLIRVGIAKPHWHTFTTAVNRDWFCDVAVVIRHGLVESQLEQVVAAFKEWPHMTTTHPTVEMIDAD